MSLGKRLVFLVVAFVLLAPCCLCGALFVTARIRLHALDRADHVKLLTGCREVIENRMSYRNDNTRWGVAYKDKIVILRPFPQNIPTAIRDLDPTSIIITKNSVLLNFSVPFRRIGLIAYESGAAQAGTRMYIDGLWLWEGR